MHPCAVQDWWISETLPEGSSSSSLSPTLQKHFCCCKLPVTTISPPHPVTLSSTKTTADYTRLSLAASNLFYSSLCVRCFVMLIRSRTRILFAIPCQSVRSQSFATTQCSRQIAFFKKSHKSAMKASNVFHVVEHENRTRSGKSSKQTTKC